jgi:hypothetical protein
MQIDGTQLHKESIIIICIEVQQNVIESGVQIRRLHTDRGEYTVVPAGSMKAYKGSRSSSTH